MHKIIKALDRERRRQGLRQADLAAKIGRQREVVRRWLTGGTDPQLGAVQEMADALGLQLTIIKTPE